MILLWNSATMTVTMTLIDGEATYDYSWEAGRTLARDMHSYIRDALAEHGVTFHDISAVGVFKGPGSFTGLRIGLTVLNTLATDLTIPIVGVTDDDWQPSCLSRINNGENDRIVMPEYGADAHVTAPRK